MTPKHRRAGGVLAGMILTVLIVLVAAPRPATATPEATPGATRTAREPAAPIPPHVPAAFQAAPESFKITYPPRPKPPIERIPARGVGDNFQLIGHNPLMDDFLIPGLTPMGIPRGGNGNLNAAAGPCVYVGSLAGSQPALVVDVSDPRDPAVVGPVPGHVPGIGHGIDDIDTVPELDLMVIHMRPAVVGGFNRENATALQIYDIGDCRHPRLVMNFPSGQELGVNTAMHMSTLWRDPANPARVLHLTSFSATTSDPGTPVPGIPGHRNTIRPDGIDIRVVDLTGCPRMCSPRVVAKWGLEAELGVPRQVRVRYPDGTTLTRSAVLHQASFTIDGTRIWNAQRGMGVFALDSELLARNLPCDPESPTVGETPAQRASHCLKLLNPTLIETLDAAGNNTPGHADWDPPFFSGGVHTAANVPGKPYKIIADEASTTPFVACPWSWLRLLYTGDQEVGPGGVRYRGDFFPRVLGVLAGAQNVMHRCPKPGAAPGPDTYGPAITRDDHGPHEPLVFPNLVIATYYSDGLKAFSIANPLTPVEVGSFYNKPVDTIRFCWTNCLPEVRDEQGRAIEIPPDRSVGPVDLRAFSRPITKDGLVYFVDSHNGLYVVKYTGPHAEEIPAEGTCVTGNIHVAGFEPCQPYR